MWKLGVEEWLVRAVMAMYKHVRTRVRSYGGSVNEWFGVIVGVLQGLHYSNGNSDTYCERGSTIGNAVC